MWVSFDCELWVFIQDSQIIAGKRIRNYTWPHFFCMRARLWSQTCTHYRYHACSIYLHPCTYSCLIVENEFSILQANCQPANTIANAKPSATVAQAVLMTHPTCSLTSHISIAKIESVAFSFGYLQLIESQSGLYSTIRNRLTMHSKSNLWQW